MPTANRAHVVFLAFVIIVCSVWWGSTVVVSGAFFVVFWKRFDISFSLMDHISRVSSSCPVTRVSQVSNEDPGRLRG